MSLNETPDFDNLLLQRATEADLNDIVNFLMRDFLYNEPLNKSIDLTESDADNLFIGLSQAGIASSLSYVLRTPSGKIAAVRLASILDRPGNENLNTNEGNNDNNNTVTNTAPLNDNAAKITKILSELENKIWILVNPRIKRLLNWLIISVDHKYVRHGLATKLLTYGLDEARLMGCQGCITEASALKSQRLFKKLGYETIHEIKHNEWLDESGKQIFKCDDGTNSIELVYKGF
uniref:aralkylamine N-acetyltransferase n=1 Tax=Parascaris univalens TaxID=6257 RepID=A0A915C4T4_PARUN